MLEKPYLKDAKIISCLQKKFGLRVDKITFIPRGADLNTAVYRIETEDAKPYFVKLRRGDFNKATVAVPKFLSDLGIKQIIPSLKTRKRQLWASLDSFKVILYPFIEGHDGYEKNLSDQQRIEFGTTLKKFHTANIPSEITNGISREMFSPHWREKLKLIIGNMGSEIYKDPVASDLAEFINTKRNETLEVVERAEHLALMLKAQPPEFILCHGDIHAWNILIDINDALYIVDWDTLIFAPKERDLMFVGGGLGGHGHTLQEEEILFYQGYGQTQIDPIAIAYYRYERIIEDIAVDSELILLSDAGGDDQVQSLKYIKSNFQLNGTIEIAYQSDKTLTAQSLNG